MSAEILCAAEIDFVTEKFAAMNPDDKGFVPASRIRELLNSCDPTCSKMDDDAILSVIARFGTGNGAAIDLEGLLRYWNSKRLSENAVGEDDLVVEFKKLDTDNSGFLDAEVVRRQLIVMMGMGSADAGDLKTIEDLVAHSSVEGKGVDYRRLVVLMMS